MKPDSAPDSPAPLCPACHGPLRDFGLGWQCPHCLVDSTLSGNAPAPFEPKPFGEYHLLAELGRGGMGTVYLAQQPRLGRSVALKMLLGGIFAQPAFLERFRREARAAAQLHHPGIAVAHDVGEVEGIAYYTMELLEGGGLDEWIASPACEPRQAAVLLEKTARAIAHAHEHGVLHRDLKPSNILLTAEGEPKVADFGLAQLAEETEAASPRVTLTNSVLGTPAYMAPEVAEGRPSGIAGDIYALGAILYEALTGQPPHVGSNAQAILAHARAAGPADPRKLKPSLPRDLAAVCMKCLEPEPAHRYPAASALADDLERFLTGRPVLARPLGTWGHLWRWTRRNQGVAAFALAFLLSLILGSILVVRQAAINAQQARALAKGHDDTRRLSHELHTHLYAADMRAAAQEISSGYPEGARRWLHDHENDPERGIEWHWLSQQANLHPFQELHRGNAYISSVSFSGDGGSLAAVTNNGHALLFDPATKRLAEPGLVLNWKPQFSAATGLLYYCVGQKVESRAVLPGGALGDPRPGPEAAQITLSPNGRWAALGSAWSVFYQRGGGGAASVMNVEENRVIWTAPEPHVCRTAVSNDGTMLATAGRDGGVALWNVARQAEHKRWTLPAISPLQFSPDGLRLAAGGLQKAWVLSVDGQAQELAHPLGHQVTEVAFSPDGTQLATACTDRVIRVWPLADPHAPPLRLHGHSSEVWTVAWDAEGRRLASGGRDGRILLWPAEALAKHDVTVPCRYQPAIFSSQSSSFYMVDGSYPEMRLRRWRSQDLSLAQEYPLNSQIIGLTPGGEAMIWSFVKDRLEWWPEDAAEPNRWKAVPYMEIHYFSQMSASPDGRLLARLDNHGLLEIRPLDGEDPPSTLQLLPKLPDGERWGIRAMEWSHDSRHLAVGTERPPFHTWLVDVDTLAVTPLSGHDDTVTGAAFSPDGQWLASSSVIGHILVWSMRDIHAAPIRLLAHPRTAADLVFAPDSRTLLSLGSLDGVKFWHVATWRELAHWPIRDASSHVSISLDGRWLAVTCGPPDTPDFLRVFPMR